MGRLRARSPALSGDADVTATVPVGRESGATTYGPQEETEPGGELGRVLLNASGPDVRFRRITGHRKTMLNRLKITHNEHRAGRLMCMR